MPHRHPPPAASATWRLDDASALAARDTDVAVRQALLLVNATGFLAGYFVMYNQWLQVGWFAAMSALWFSVGGFQDFVEGLRRDRWLAALGGLTFMMLVRSSVLESPGMSMSGLWQGWLSSGMLLAVLLMLWQVARLPRVVRQVGLPLVLVAAGAAAGSMVWYYGLREDAIFGSRLQNWFVYGGWNTVCSGLTFGFAAVWAAAGWNNSAEKKDRRLWLALLLPLLAATFFTMSRGALLALVAGHAGLLVVCGWRRAWRPLMLLAAALGLFLAGAPLISKIALGAVSERLGVPAQELTEEMIGDSVVPANPMGRLVTRADNGRGNIVRAALASMTTWQDWTFGKGMWSSNDSWSCSLYWYPEHLHSVFTDALVRGGVPGLVGLLGIVAWGLRRAMHLARQGEEVWLMLACFGVAGVLFDGDSAFSLLSQPRFETLILWVPLVMASARYLPQRRRLA